MISIGQNTRRLACISIFLPLMVVALWPGRGTAARDTVAQQQDCEDPDSRLIVSLDDCVQQRFKDIDRGFGYRRIVRIGETPHRFSPENAKELTVVGALKEAHLDVVLYLAGRSVLAEESRVEDILLRKLIKGPAAVTPTAGAGAGLPGPAELWEHSRAAMLAFQTSNTYNFAVGKWKFAARPVRASEQSCLDCHRGRETRSMYIMPKEGQTPPPSLAGTNPLKIGDPLGVVLYAFERNEK